MKTLGWLPGITLLALTAVGALRLFGPPLEFADRSLQDAILDEIHSGAVFGARWAGSPTETAYKYVYEFRKIERLQRAQLSISTHYLSPDTVVVTLTNPDCLLDKMISTCDRITLHREDAIWRPVRHQYAWMGEGTFGWSNRPIW